MNSVLIEVSSILKPKLHWYIQWQNLKRKKHAKNAPGENYFDFSLRIHVTLIVYINNCRCLRTCMSQASKQSLRQEILRRLCCIRDVAFAELITIVKALFSPDGATMMPLTTSIPAGLSEQMILINTRSSSKKKTLMRYLHTGLSLCTREKRFGERARRSLRTEIYYDRVIIRRSTLIARIEHLLWFPLHRRW